MPFIKTLESFAPMSDDCKAALNVAITSKNYKKGQTILLPGNINTQLYFIETGLAKVYYDADADADARQIISWFGYEGGFLCSVRSYLSQVPSKEYIEILEDSKLLAIEYNDLQRLFEDYPELNLIFRLVSQFFILIYDARTNILRERIPKRQYEAFLKLYPKLGNRVRVGDVAAYLNRDISTISNVRNEIAKETRKDLV